MTRTNISRSKVSRNKKLIRKPPRKKEKIVGKVFRTKQKIKPVKKFHNIFPAKKVKPPVDIRDEIRVVNNINFQAKPQFSFIMGQPVTRKSDLRQRKLIVLGFYGDKIFLNDLTFTGQEELRAIDSLEFILRAS